VETLELLRGIWIDILGDDDVTDEDNFFAIGGDSMMALEVATRARELGLHVTDSAVLRNPVLRDMASLAGTRPTAN
jgi:aryl carrier-like protein